MRVLVVSGIWPPDVGGPASHAPEVADFLHGRGHHVEVVTTAWEAPVQPAYRVSAVARSIPPGLRHLRGAALVHQRAGAADVVYTTGMFGRSALGSAVARKPYVVKLTADPAFERARRRRLFDGDVDRFQSFHGGPSVSALRLLRNAELRGAAHVFTPSAYLRELAISWGVPAGRVSVLPNPSPRLPERDVSRDVLRRSFAIDGNTVAFAGRLAPQKALDVALDAVAELDEVTLLIAGEGDERRRLERRAGDRVRFLGPLPRERVLELFRAADAAILTSKWENFPHSIVEALSVGTPVIATTTGGVAEVVRDGENGLLFAPGDAHELAAVLTRYFADPALRERLRNAAAPSVADYQQERVFSQLEATLLAVAV
jgi:glycosyltransferase involved in cell wall biosynthesis